MKSTNMLLSAGLPLLMIAGQAVAFGCKAPRTFGTCADGITHWYDPDDGQICDPLDCGGGRAPPKTDRPGCPQYKGTEIYQTAASYMPCFVKPGLQTTTTVAPPAISTTTTKSSPTEAPVTDTIVQTLTRTVATDGAGPSESSSTPSESTSAPSDPPSTTEPATLPAGGQSTGSSSSSTSSTSAPATGNAGNILGGSLVAVAGAAAFGAIALL